MMTKPELRNALLYRMLLQGIVRGNLRIGADGRVTAPGEMAPWATKFPADLTPQAHALLASYMLESMSADMTVTGMLRAMSQLVHVDSLTTTFNVRPIVRLCRERQTAIARFGDELAGKIYRIIRPDGVLVVPEVDWQPGNEALDLACMYHMAHERKELDDQYGLTRFLQVHVDRLSVGVFWEYIDRVPNGMFKYIEDESGVLVDVLDPIELRLFGRAIYARGGMVDYLANKNDYARRYALLVERGFADP